MRARAMFSAAAALLAGAGCTTRLNPEYCGPGGTGCALGFQCHPVTLRCEIAEKDAGPNPDVAAERAPDTGFDLPPDAPGTCATSDDCRTPGALSCVQNRCVECTYHGQCTSPRSPLCVGNACVSCRAGPPDGCARKHPETPACEPVSGQCVECVASAGCADPDRPVCVANLCAACTAVGAAIDACAQKSELLPYCHPTTGQCVQCLYPILCSNQFRPCFGSFCFPY